MPKYVASRTHDLVDELELLVFPVVVGTGKRLFGTETDTALDPSPGLVAERTLSVE